MDADWFHRSWMWSLHSLCGGHDRRFQHPCCHQRLHVTCLTRSFSWGGLHLLQSVDCRVARSSSFLASSLFHGCLVDFDVPPGNRETNSLVLPLGFPRPPHDLTLLCCPRSGPRQLSNQWDPQWLCLRCGRSMELSPNPATPLTSFAPSVV